MTHAEIMDLVQAHFARVSPQWSCPICHNSTFGVGDVVAMPTFDAVEYTHPERGPTTPPNGQVPFVPIFCQRCFSVQLFALRGITEAAGVHW